MISNVSNAGYSTTAAAAQMKQATGMNKDDFLKLFLAQLQNQDPLKPQDSSQFLAQLAQMSQVEQGYNTASSMEQLLAASQNQFQLTAAGFIGKGVTADAGTLTLAEGTQPVAFHFDSETALTAVTLKVTDAAGTVVAEKKLGAMPAGTGSYTWDGLSGGKAVPAGVYSVSVSGTTSTGSTVTMTPLVSGSVAQVSLLGSAAQLQTGRTLLGMSTVQRITG